MTDIMIPVEDIEAIKAGYISSLNLIATLSKENHDLRATNARMKSDITSLSEKNVELAKKLGQSTTKRRGWW